MLRTHCQCHFQNHRVTEHYFRVTLYILLCWCLGDPPVSSAGSGRFGELGLVEVLHWMQLGLKICLGELGTRVYLHLLLQLYVERLLQHLHHRVPAAGVHHPLLDRHRVSRHGVDEH